MPGGLHLRAMDWSRPLSSSLLLVPLAVLLVTGCERGGQLVPDAWVDAPAPTHTPRPLPEPSWDAQSPGSDGSLLASYADRSPNKQEEVERWQLPWQSRAAIAELLIVAADDDPAGMGRILSSNARWGLPDRRQFQSRPVFTKDDPLGIEFLSALRTSASRFKKRAKFILEPLPGFEMFAASGAEPVWASYFSDDGQDVLAFRMIVEGGQLKIDYVGLFVERPRGMLRVSSEIAGDPPPTIPLVKAEVSLAPPKSKSKSTPEPSEQTDEETEG
ncbi:hypothetical protein G6O69_15000 [Pseudenhygromyxa sp. WMMC2535]|uniref:hypothetical protein n=1 Tax=Pseudenhygromyxa sp. WMMC2535 TaxID=2712867 RepID=UPI001595ABE3|nr:hypothetical protein [Pseudenhygromyxa sp. WMMC2535]NVB39149.1 hypothetical protein [Pseudenhygromyxa sp. WMMC2535]